MQAYIPSSLKEENDNLIDMAMNLTDDISDKEFLEKYASEEFKEFIQRSEKRRKRLWQQGVVEN